MDLVSAIYELAKATESPEIEAVAFEASSGLDKASDGFESAGADLIPNYYQLSGRKPA
jgi:hypothetical protein